MSAYRVYLVMDGVRGLGLGLIVTAPIYRIQEAGFGPLELVLAGTSLEVAYFLSEVPTGVVADLYSRRMSCVIAAFLMGAGWLLEGSFPSLVPIMVAQAILGIGWTFFSGAAEAWIAGEVGDDLAARAIVRGEQSHLVLMIVGGFAGAALATVELRLPLIVAGASHLVLGIILLVAMPERRFAPAEHTSRLSALTTTIRHGARTISRDRVLVLIVVSLFLMGAASEGLDRLWEAHLLTNVRLPSLGGISRLYWFAIVSGGATALSVAALSISRRFVERESDRTLATTAVVMTALVAAGCAVFGLSEGAALAIGAYFVVRIGRNVLDPTLKVWTIRHSEPAVRATVISMTEQGHSIGEIAAGPVVGFVGRLASIPSALVASAVLEAAAIPLLAREAARAPTAPPRT